MKFWYSDVSSKLLIGLPGEKVPLPVGPDSWSPGKLFTTWSFSAWLTAVLTKLENLGLTSKNSMKSASLALGMLFEFALRRSGGLWMPVVLVNVVRLTFETDGPNGSYTWNMSSPAWYRSSMLDSWTLDRFDRLLLWGKRKFECKWNAWKNNPTF